MNIFLLIIILYLIYIEFNNSVIENFKWIKREKCEYKTNQTILNALQKYNISKGNINDWNLYLPCTYNNIKYESKLIPKSKLGKKIFLINNCDAITSKNNLWKLIINKYGLSDAKKIMPETYILQNFNKYINNDDKKRFIKNYTNGKLYILKKNIQRQQGLKITDNFSDIINGYNNGYVIAQDLLQNPYLINGRKINLRVYLLIVCKNDKLTAYAHNNGFMYYTSEKFKKNTTDMKCNVTTGYVDRQIYIDNPLTLLDFKKYLDNPDRNLNEYESKLVYNNKLSILLFNRIYSILNKIIKSSIGHICGTYNVPKHISKQTSFQLFGVDFSVSNKLEPQIMEINKGPDLNAKDARDKQVKETVAIDTLTILGLTDEKSNSYVKIY